MDKRNRLGSSINVNANAQKGTGAASNFQLRSGLIALLFLAIFFVALAPGSAAARSTPFITGFSAPDLGLVGPLGYERIKASGAKTVRVFIFWRTVAPQVKPARWDPRDPNSPYYYWTDVDAHINAARSAGLSVFVALYQAPEWAERCEYPKSEGVCDPDPRAFADFATAAAKRYNGQKGAAAIRYWAAWNEPNLPLFFMPQFQGERKVSPDKYRILLNSMSNAVKRVNRQNKVINGGLAPLKTPSGIAPLDFSKRVFCLSGEKRFKSSCRERTLVDVWSTNPYTLGYPNYRPPGKDDVSLNGLAAMGNLVKAAAAKRKTLSRKTEFWVTEFSWDSDYGAVSEEKLKRWVPEALHIAYQAGVTRFYWLSLRDWDLASAPLLPGFPGHSGLWRRGATLEQDTEKLFAQGFRFPMVAYRVAGGIYVWGRTANSRSGPVKIEYSDGSALRYVATIRADRNGIFQKKIRSNLGRDLKGTVRASHDTQISLPFPLAKETMTGYIPPFG